MYMYKEDETGYIIFDLLKKMSIDIITTYPNIILNKVKKKHNISCRQYFCHPCITKST